MKPISILRTGWLALLNATLGLVLLAACQGRGTTPTGGGPNQTAGPALPVQREAQADSMDALLVGKLALVDNCLRVQNDEGADYLPIWPQGFTVRGEGQALQVINPDNQVAASLGDTLQVGGGEIPAEAADSLTVAPVSEQCSGPYWLVGALSK